MPNCTSKIKLCIIIYINNIFTINIAYKNNSERDWWSTLHQAERGHLIFPSSRRAPDDGLIKLAHPRRGPGFCHPILTFVSVSHTVSQGPSPQWALLSLPRKSARCHVF